MGVRFVHAADLHLGSPLQAVGVQSPELRSQLRDATYTAFERIIDITLEEAVDFLIVAGDLYDQKSRSIRANEFIAEQLARLEEADIPAYVNYGNHDPLGDATSYVKLPDNVHEFGHQEAEEVIYPSEDDPAARIWGQSYRTQREGRKMYRSFTPVDTSIPNIGILHTGLDPDSDKYVPCSQADLASKDDIHYWALGHIHQTQIRNTDPPIVYPGIPQGRHVEEHGIGGCLLVELDTTGDFEMEFVPTSPIVWRQPGVSIADNNGELVETLDDIQARIKAAANDLTINVESLEEDYTISVRADAFEPDGYVCRWHVHGRGSAHEILSSAESALESLEEGIRDEMAHHSPFVWTESVADRTGPPLPDIEDLRGDDRVVDEFLELTAELKAGEDTREEMRDKTNYDNTDNVWEVVDDREEVPDDRLALTDEKFDELIERAEQLVLDELAKRRIE